MTIDGGLSAANTGFKLIKSLREIVKRPDYDASEINARLLELQELMLEAHEALNDAASERRKLEQKISDLSRMADFGKDFKFEEGVYWHPDHPFAYCPNCWNIDRKPMQLNGPFGANNTSRWYWKCPVHDTTYYTNRRSSNF